MIGANNTSLPIRHPRMGGSRENVSVGETNRMYGMRKLKRLCCAVVIAVLHFSLCVWLLQFPREAHVHATLLSPVGIALHVLASPLITPLKVFEDRLPGLVARLWNHMFWVWSLNSVLWGVGITVLLENLWRKIANNRMQQRRSAVVEP